MAGGLKVSDPAVDLAVAVAILSSTFDLVVSPRWCFAAEVGLSGEIRPVPYLERRVAEAAKLGFEKIFVSGYNIPKSLPGNIEVEKISGMAALCKQIF
jgi:DNA repair protein RadA/Sms